MAAQDIRPNVHIFNAILTSLRSYGGLSRSLAMQTFSEMIAVDIGKLVISLAEVSVLEIWHVQWQPSPKMAFSLDFLEDVSFTVLSF